MGQRKDEPGSVAWQQATGGAGERDTNTPDEWPFQAPTAYKDRERERDRGEINMCNKQQVEIIQYPRLFPLHINSHCMCPVQSILGTCCVFVLNVCLVSTTPLLCSLCVGCVCAAKQFWDTTGS